MEIKVDAGHGAILVMVGAGTPKRTFATVKEIVTNIAHVRASARTGV